MAILRVPPIKVLENLPKLFLAWLRDLTQNVSFGGVVGQDYYRATTTDGTPLTLWELDVPEKSTCLITLHSIGMRSDAGAVQSQRQSVFAYRNTGNVIVAEQVDAGADDDHFYIGTLTASVAMSGSATQVLLKATGVAAQTWKWQGYIEHSVLSV